ncbi:hypothetical protein Tco_1559201, partial [Tanacetum coccineum]
FQRYVWFGGGAVGCGGVTAVEERSSGGGVTVGVERSGGGGVTLVVGMKCVEEMRVYCDVREKKKREIVRYVKMRMKE